MLHLLYKPLIHMSAFVVHFFTPSFSCSMDPKDKLKFYNNILPKALSHITLGVDNSNGL